MTNYNIDPRTLTGDALAAAEAYALDPFGEYMDYSPMPSEDDATGCMNDIFENMYSLLQGTRLEGRMQPILWKMVNVFEAELKAARRQLDEAQNEQRMILREFDGSEVKDSQLHNAVKKAADAEDFERAFEKISDIAQGKFEELTGKPWLAAASKMTRHHTQTAAVMDARSFQRDRRKLETQAIPDGTPVAIVGGPDITDVETVFGALDKVHKKYKNIVLVHGGHKIGTDKIAASWAKARNVATVVAAPDWEKHKKAAGFRRNEDMLRLDPIGMIALPGTGVTKHAVQIAREQGIPVMEIQQEQLKD